jgi:DNA-binding IclR family transcriptional regulator
LAQGARDLEEKYQRRRILELAGRRQGKLTVADVATSLGMDLKDAEHILDTLVDGRHVDVEVSEEGRLFYVFPDLIAANRREH